MDGGGDKPKPTTVAADQILIENLKDKNVTEIVVTGIFIERNKQGDQCSHGHDDDVGYIYFCEPLF